MVEMSTLNEKAIDGLIEKCLPAATDAVTFLRAQFDAGLARVWFPPG
jgi:hypothetical protein